MDNQSQKHFPGHPFKHTHKKMICKEVVAGDKTNINII